MKKENEILRKQVEEFQTAISKAIKDMSMQHIKRYGYVEAIATSVSLARSLSASLAVLTRDLSKKEEKEVHNWFFECIEKGALQFKEKLPSDHFEDLDANNIPS